MSPRWPWTHRPRAVDCACNGLPHVALCDCGRSPLRRLCVDAGVTHSCRNQANVPYSMLNCQRRRMIHLISLRFRCFHPLIVRERASFRRRRDHDVPAMRAVLLWSGGAGSPAVCAQHTSSATLKTKAAASILFMIHIIAPPQSGLSVFDFPTPWKRGATRCLRCSSAQMRPTMPGPISGYFESSLATSRRNRSREAAGSGGRHPSRR